MAIALSPDGRWLAYQSDETGRIEVFIRPFPNTDEGKWQVTSGGGTAPLWARNGRELFYLSSDNFMTAVSVTTSPTVSLGDPSPLFPLSRGMLSIATWYYTPWDVGPDGRFIMVRGVGEARDAAAPLIVVENWLEELKTLVQQ